MKLASVVLMLTTLFLAGEAVAECNGRTPLYDPQANTQDASPATSWLGKSPFWQDIPIAFASSGDACLGPIPIYLISRHPEPARDTHAMARRLAPEMAAYSRRTGMESCARLCATPQGTIVANLITLRAHVVCLAEPTTCPQGSQPTPETIHSHPPQRAFIANAVDALGWDEAEIEGKLTLTGYPDSLSPNDRRQAPVWMVGTQGQLIWLATPNGTEVERP